MADFEETREPLLIRVAQAVASPFFYHPVGPVGITMLIMLLTPSLGMAMGILLAGNETSLPLVPWLFGLAGVAVGIPLLGLLILLPRLIMDSRAERRAWEAKQS